MSTQPTKRVFVVGVGMTKFMKPGRDGNPDYPQFGAQAVQRALRDANIPYSKIQAAAACYVYGDSTSGQRVLYEVGLIGLPVYNVHNNCSTGSSGIHLMAKLIEGGIYDCTLVIGFDKMERGSLNLAKWPDRTQPLDLLQNKSDELLPAPKNTLFAPRLFGNAGIEHNQKYGSKPEHMAKIAYKNHLHSTNNPYSQFRDQYTLEEILKSPQIYGPITKLQCCPTSDGAAAAILCSEKFVAENNLQDQAVEILAIALTTDDKSTFDGSMMKLAGTDMSSRAAKEVYQKAGVCPMQVGVVELHDCFSANEMVTYEALGLCQEGKAGEFIDKGDNTYGGRVVCNVIDIFINAFIQPSGGLISKGHPLGATGLAQCAELCWQLRGMAGKRQVHNLQYALQHNIGLGGACVVALYRKFNSNKGWSRSDQTSDPDVLEQLEKQKAKL